jgi:beta-phosphoglucomutase family hydrolase
VTHTAAHATTPQPADPVFAAVIFDMDSVVTDTAGLHAAAWQALFDQVLPTLAASRDIDIEADYHAHIDGPSREDGVRAFLASRGLAIPERSAVNRPGTLTVSDLAARKQQIFDELVAAHGMTAYPSTVALLHRLKSAGVATALVTASRNSGAALATAGVNELFAVVVDGADAASLHLAGKPAPDMFLEAARQLGVQPEQAVVIEDALVLAFVIYFVVSALVRPCWPPSCAGPGTAWSWRCCCTVSSTARTTTTAPWRR